MEPTRTRGRSPQPWTDPYTGFTTTDPHGPEWGYPAHLPEPLPPPPPPAPPPAGPDRSRVVIATALLAVASLVVGFIVANALQADSSSRADENRRAQTPLPTTPTPRTFDPQQLPNLNPNVPFVVPTIPPLGGNPPATPTPTDPDVWALRQLVVQDTDLTVGTTYLVGDEITGQTTLDICNAEYPSELLRTARLQVSATSATGMTGLSTEAVLYRAPGAAVQALRELRRAADECPTTAVASPIGGPTITTRFNTAPDGAWAPTPTVERLAFNVTVSYQTGRAIDMTLVFLRRGRVLLAVYFVDDSIPMSIGGHTTPNEIVTVFAERLAALPVSVTNG